MVATTSKAIAVADKIKAEQNMLGTAA
jgi:hypothetical protein